MDSWLLGDQFVTPKGAATCQLFDESNKPVQNIAPTSYALKLPWKPSNFEGATEGRLSISFTVNDELFEWAKALDDFTIQYLTKNSERLLKRKLNEQQVRDSYKSPLIVKGDYIPSFRTKINLVGGQSACRFWDERGVLQPEPEDWLSFKYTPSFAVRHLWQMGSDFGWTIETRDLMLQTQSVQCPFAFTESSDETIPEVKTVA